MAEEETVQPASAEVPISMKRDVRLPVDRLNHKFAYQSINVKTLKNQTI